jgi:O-antigen ligase
MKSPPDSGNRPQKRRDLLTPVLATMILGGLTYTARHFGAFWIAVGVAVAVFLACTAPRTRVLTLLFMALVADVPSDQPASGLWESPLFPLGTFLFENLRKSTGIEFLHIPAFDLILLALLAPLLVGRGGTNREATSASCLQTTLALDLAALALLELMGLVTGGDFQQSLWQMRPLAYVPLLALVFLRAFSGREDLIAVGRIIIAAALTKCAIGLYFYFAWCRPQGIFPTYITSHSDSALFGSAILITLARWIEDRTGRNMVRVIAFVPLIGLTTALNNRRLAYVSIAAALMALYFMMSRSALKRAVHRAALVAAPILGLYLAVGWHSNHLIFAPIRSFQTMTSPEEDSSTEMRDIENFNLIRTIRQNPIFGTGFGHPYDEVVKGDDISKQFPQYRYIAHNDVLCLWMLAGLVGFVAIWLPLATAVFLAMRTYQRSGWARDRTAALCTVGGAVIYMVQGWGDMGFHSWEGAIVAACALTAGSKVAIAAGVWPARKVHRSRFALEVSPLRTAEERA